MSAHPSSSSAPPPLPPRTHPPTSLSPTLPSSSSSTHYPSISMTSPSLHSSETARQIAEARAALEASMTNIGSSLDITLRSRAQDLHLNSKQLEKQQKDVVRATEALRKEGDRLKKVADEGMRTVKELGNVQNWAEMLESDFLVLGETLRLVERGNGSGNYTGTEEGSEWETGSEGSRGKGGRETTSALEGEAEGKKKDADTIIGGETQEPASHQVEGKNERVDRVLGDEPNAGILEQRTVDTDGDTTMDGTEGDVNDKKKGKAVQVFADAASTEHAVSGGSSTATNTTGPTSNPSSSSVHTAASAAS